MLRGLRNLLRRVGLSKTLQATTPSGLQSARGLSGTSSWMWLADTPDESDGIRQGDVVAGLVLPKHRLPMTYARGPGTEVAPGQQVILPTPSRDRLHLVVSQCCTIENGDFVSLVPIVSTAPLSEDERLPYLADEPPVTDGVGGYVFDAFYLHPLPGVIDHPSGRLLVADLVDVQSYAGSREMLIRGRVARMTPSGRRLLRIKLAYLWGRPEGDDVSWFEERGLSAGPSR